MDPQLKSLLANLHPKKTRDLVGAHVKSLELTNQTATLIVDKRYAFHEIISHEHIDAVIQAVKKTFGAACQTVLKLHLPNTSQEREKAISHTVHYR